MKYKFREAFMDMAIRFGQTSEAKRRKVGALIVQGDRTISEGVNGQPPNWPTEVCEDENGDTLPTVRHAEIAALEKLWNSTEVCQGADIYVSCCPCLPCAIKIQSAGIKNVYYSEDYRDDEGFKHLNKHGIKVHRI